MSGPETRDGAATLNGPKHYVVTGGGAGIGRAIVEDLIAHDAQAHVTAIDLAAEAIASLAQAHPHQVTGVVGDVTDRDLMHATVATAAEAGTLVGVVSAAGIHEGSPSIDIDAERIRRVMAVHIEASLWVAQAAARAMIAHGAGGSIVNFSSVAQDFAWPGRMPYAIAKAGIGALTRTLAVEWADHGIRVNAVAPGYVNTRMISDAIEKGIIDGEQRREMHALRRFAEPAEIASAVRFLLSDDASFVTGEILKVDGGFTVKH